jgi:dTDP-4-amino-4,6-dideoxy-D-galactose acyltransferase
LMAPAESQSGTKVCQVLAWDSEFFGCRIARYRGSRCLPEDVAAIAAECVAESIDCVYVLADVADTESIRALQENRAYMADARVTFGAEVAAAIGVERSSGISHAVRPAVDSDIPALVSIAAVSHRDTRFYADRHFATARCDSLYQVWIEKSCQGLVDAVLVAEDAAHQPIGYVTCQGKGAARGHIGLLAVKEDARGRGAGRALLHAALDWFAANKVASMTVATQLRNVRALRFYGREGLLITSVELWFHLWPRDPVV